MRQPTSYRLPVIHPSLVNTHTTELALFDVNKLPTGTLSSLHAYWQLNQGRSSLLQNMTVGSSSPFPISSYRNFIFAFDRMNLLSFSSFPCAKVNSTLIVNSIPLDYSLTVFIIFPPSHHSPSFST